MYTNVVSDYDKFYSLDVLGVEDKGENDQLEFRENIMRQSNERNEVNIIWIPGSELLETNESQSRKRLQNVERKLRQNEQLRNDYTEIVILNSQLTDGIIEKVSDEPAGKRVLFTPQTSCEARCNDNNNKNGFLCKCKTAPFLNKCMYTGLALQPFLWDILIRATMSPYLLLGDIPKAFFTNQCEFRR